MKQIVIFISLIFMSLSGLTQELNQKVNDEKAGIDILVGECDKAGLMEGEFGVYFEEYFNAYEPDKGILKSIKQKKKGISITIVLGTWCHDSKEQVPRFYKILSKLKWNSDLLNQYCVNTSKVAEGIDLESYDIVKVPTFIIYRDGNEIGRIIETPVTTLENDLLMILE